MDWLNKLVHAITQPVQQAAGWVGHEAQQLPQQLQQATHQAQQVVQPQYSRATQTMQQISAPHPQQLQQLQNLQRVLQGVNFQPQGRGLQGGGMAPHITGVSFPQQPQTTFLDLYNESAPGGGLSPQQNPYQLDSQDRPYRNPFQTEAMYNDLSGFNVPGTIHNEQDTINGSLSGQPGNINQYMAPQGQWYRRPQGSMPRY